MQLTCIQVVPIAFRAAFRIRDFAAGRWKHITTPAVGSHGCAHNWLILIDTLLLAVSWRLVRIRAEIRHVGRRLETTLIDQWLQIRRLCRYLSKSTEQRQTRPDDPQQR